MRQVFFDRSVREAYEQLHARNAFHPDPKLHLRVLEHLEGGSWVLDVGCGENPLLSSLKGIDCVGVDIAMTALKKARTRSKAIRLVQADAENLPFRSKSFDRLVCLGSLEHFRDLNRALREMVRVLTPSGRICILVPNSRFIGRPINELRWRLFPNHSQPIERLGSLQGWKGLLMNHGLRVVRVEADNSLGLPFPFGWIFNHLIRLILPLRYCYQFLLVCELAS